MIPISKDIQNLKQKACSSGGLHAFCVYGVLSYIVFIWQCLQKVEINLVIVDVISMQSIIFALRLLRRQYVDNIVLREGGIFVI